MRKIYFAHPNAEKDSRIKKLIVQWLEWDKYRVIDPFEKEEEQTGTPYEVWRKDLELIDECDEVFAWIPNKKVIGVIAELEYARSKGKFIFVLSAINSVFLDFLDASHYCEVRYEYGWYINRMKYDLGYPITECGF